MIEFKKITLSNFKGYGKKPTSVKLDRMKSTLIIGDNTDIGEAGTSRNGVGKCLGKDTPILMFDGTIKLVQDVLVGDQLMGPDGTPRNVLSLARGKEELFKVNQNIGDDYVVNKSHILSLRVGTTRPKYGHYKGDIVNVSVEEYLSYPSSVKRGVCGYVADLTKLNNGKEVFEPWLIGAWLADGTTSESAITYNTNDHEMYENVRKIAQGHGWSASQRQGSSTCFTEYYKGGFRQKLIDLGLLNNKHIPYEYLMASYDQRLEILAGILDGDGFKNRGRSVDIILKDNKLPYDVAFIARSVGLRVTIADKFAKCQNFDGEIYKRLTITGDVSKIPHRLKRKQGTGRPDTAKPRNYGSTGISLESLGEGDYYGFEIDGDRLFCLGDFTVTHNTSMLEAVVFALYGKGLEKNKPDDLVNFKNLNKMYVDLDFSVNGKVCNIVRGRKPNILELTVDGKSFTRDSMKNTDEEILNLIGVTYDVFMSVFFLNPFKETFMSMTSAAQRNLMEQFLSLDVLASRAESLKSIKKDLAVDIKLKNKDVDSAKAINSRVERTVASLVEKETDFEKKRQQTIREYQDIIDDSKHIDFDLLIGYAKKVNDLKDEKSKVTDNTNDIVVTEAELESVESLIDKCESLSERSEEWERKREEEVSKLEDKLSNLPSVDDIKLRDEIDSKIQSLSETILRKETGKNTALSEMDNITSKVETLTKEYEVLDSGQCPYCEQRHTDENKLTDIEQTINTHLEQGDKLKATIEDYEQTINNLLEEKKEIGTKRPDIDNTTTERDVEYLLEKIDDAKNKSNEVLLSMEGEQSMEDLLKRRDKINTSLTSFLAEQTKNRVRSEELESAIKDYTTRCTSVVGVCDIGEIKLLKEQFSTLEGDMEKERAKDNPYTDQIADERSYENVDELEKELLHLEEKERHIGYLVKLLTDPKSFIRKNITEKFLPYLNKRIFEYTTMLQLPHVAEIQSDMTVDIEYMGKSVPHTSLSRGERLRLDASTSLAFRDLLSVLGKSSNIVLVDEYMDSSIDESGVNVVMKLLIEKCPNLFLISHRDQFVDLVDEVLTIKKRNGFSFIE